MKGFLQSKPKLKKTRYWISCYNKENEDDPISVERKEISFDPGEDRDRKMLSYCHNIFKASSEVWEVLVHKGPSEVPESGEQIVARISREPFDGAEELTV